MSFIRALDQRTTSSRALVCDRPGMTKNTYGTGCFMLMHTGERPVHSGRNLLSTVAGAAVQWLRDGLGIIRSSAEVEPLASSVPDNGGAYRVPAFAGLGAPQWDTYARGAMLGITRGTTAVHLARATLERIAFQTADLLGVPVVRPLVTETTALGAGYLAGLAVGYWQDRAEFGRLWQAEQTFTPTMTLERATGWEAP